MSIKHPRRNRYVAGWALALSGSLQPLCASAETVSVERQTIEQLRATTMALIDALDRQTQQSRDRQEQMARQAIDQQRVTTLALIEVLASQGLLSRERADVLMRLSTTPLNAAAAPADAPRPAYPLPAPPAPAAAAPLPQGLPPAAAAIAAGAAGLALGSAAAAGGPAGASAVGTVAGNAATAAAAAAAPRQPVWGDPPLAAAPPARTTAAVRVPYVSESLRAQMREEIRNDVLAVAREERWADPRLLPDWVRGVTLHGDLRVRAEHDHLPDTNAAAFDYRSQKFSPAWSPDLSNTTIDRQRLTLRARLAFDAKVGDDVEAGLRLSTGTTSGPTSSSQTLGSGFNKSALVLDRGFVRWEPVQDFRLLAGRFANPFFGSDLLWPDDLGFDGIAVQAERNISSGLYAFAAAGAFPLEEFSTDKRDKWLYGAQLGLDWSLSDRTQWRVGLAVFDFHNVEGVRETTLPPAGDLIGTTGYFSSQYPSSVRLKGNTLIRLNDINNNAASPTWGLASKFRPVNLATTLSLKHFNPYEITLGLDYVKNSGFDIKDIERRAGESLAGVLRNRSTGLQARVAVGKPKLGERGDWLVSAALRHFERDAWMDGFTDTTWNLGGTNYRGFSVTGLYALDRRSTVAMRLTSTRNLSEGLTNMSSAPLRIDVLQVDMNARF